jgi:hypothetical protein
VPDRGKQQEADVKPLLWFVGASGTGKSTLAQWAAGEFDLPRFESVNTKVYEDHGTTYDQAITDPPLIAHCQREIFRRVLEGFERAVAAGRGLAADRCIDLIVYTSDMLGGRAFYTDWGLERLTDIARRPESLLFFVRPDPAVLERARATDGGRRTMFLTEDVVRRVDGATEMLLDDLGLKYVTLDSGRMKVRTNTVRRVVELWQGGQA